MKRFEGWEPTTTYEYEDGLLIRSVPETEWDEHEQGWMLALAEYRALRCRGCGNSLAQTTAMGDAREWRVRKLRCHSCDALAIQQNAFKGQRPEAVLWSVEKR